MCLSPQSLKAQIKGFADVVQVATRYHRLTGMNRILGAIFTLKRSRPKKDAPKESLDHGPDASMMDSCDMSRISANSEADIGVVVIVGGPQYRVGSHRQFVSLSRTLASGGFPVLRFDYRVMGDSTGEMRDFLSVTHDISVAASTMRRELPTIKTVVLWGLCDGATAALLSCHVSTDKQIMGLCLLNPWVRSEVSLARTLVKHYYAQRLLQGAFRAKLVDGGVATTAMAELWRNLRAAWVRPPSPEMTQTVPYQDRMARALGEFRGNTLVLLSGNDYTAKEFTEYIHTDPSWTPLLQHSKIITTEVPVADHTFSGNAARDRVEKLTLEWIEDVIGQQICTP